MEQSSAAIAIAPVKVEQIVSPMGGNKGLEKEPELETEADSTQTSHTMAGAATDLAPTTTRDNIVAPSEARGNEDADNETSSSEEDEDKVQDKQLDDVVSKLTLEKLPRPKLKPPRTLETTLFDRLETMYGPGIKRMLTVQYR